MNRNTRTLVVVGVAIVLAGLASWGAYQAILSLPAREVTVGKQDMIVAARNIPVGVMVTPEMIKKVDWPAEAPVPGGTGKTEDVVNRGVIVPILENEPITENKLAPKALSPAAGLVPTITPGMRAMSVRVNNVIAVAGYVVTGTYVDVVVTVRTGNESISKVVLSNVRVLAADKDVDTQKAQQGAPQDAQVVTLLVTPEDGEKLTLATTQGQIALALRNPLDTVPTETRGAVMSRLLGAPAPPPVTKTVGGRPRVVTPPPPPPPPPPPTVTGIRGSAVSTVIIK